MRTDVKIGAAIAFVVVVIGTWAAIFHFGAHPSAPAVKPSPAKPTNIVIAERAPTSAPRRLEIAASSHAASPASKPAETAKTLDRPWWESSAGKTATSAPAPSSLARNTAATRPSDLARPATPVSPAVAASMPTGMSHSYKVKHSDTYWNIAKGEYGDGSLYALIQSANKNAALHEGMTITIPPKPSPVAVAAAPVAPAASATPTAAAAPGKAGEGSTGVDQATGKKFYVVKSGDRGFYGIARDALGDARLVDQIKAANPGVDSSKLKIGQRIWIPASAAATSRPAGPVMVAPTPPARTATRVTAPVAPAPARSPAPAPTPAPAAPGGSAFD